MSEDLTERVNFEIIRYANCWEDADILLEGLAPQTDSKILSIGSAGDNSFSLLTSSPALVVAVDLSKPQLYLIELKKVCFKKLDYEELLSFLGFLPSSNREQVFQALKNEMTRDAKNYWERNLQIIKDGVIYSGKFENYFKIFSGKILPFIHSQRTVRELFNHKTAAEQAVFYNTKWNTWRWRLLFKIFFSKYILGKYGRDPEFLKEVTVSVSEFTFNKAGKHLQSAEALDNFILHFNLTGNFGNLLPNYLQKNNYEKIKTGIDRLEIFEGYAQDSIRKFGKFNCMNLSNIFEYMNNTVFMETAKELVNGLETGGRLGYWNLMVPRKISGILPGKVRYEKELSLALTEKDKGFFYNQFIIDQKV